MLVTSHPPVARSLHDLLMPLAPLDGPYALLATMLHALSAWGPALGSDRGRRCRSCCSCRSCGSAQHEATVRRATIFSNSEAATHQRGGTTTQPAVGAASDDDPSHSAAAARPHQRSFLRLIHRDRVLSSCIRLCALIRGRVRMSSMYQASLTVRDRCGQKPSCRREVHTRVSYGRLLRA